MNLTTSITVKNLSKSIEDNENYLRQAFHNCSDIVYRKIQIQGQPILLFVYVDGMSNIETIEQNILKPLLYEGFPQGLSNISRISEVFKQDLFSFMQTKAVHKMEELIQNVLKANFAILIDGENKAIIANEIKFEKRNVEPPTLEPSLRGVRESFTEVLRTNTTMLRRRIVTPNLKFESLRLGVTTQTDVAIAYIEGRVDETILNEVRKRLNRIQTDAVLSAGIIEELIEDVSYSPFPQLQNTERPDVAAASLLEGRVAIITDGTSFALILPVTFWTGLQAPDDYTERFLYVTISRWLRFLFVLISLLSSSTYLALTTYHPEMVPLRLMLSVAAAHEMSPFPTIIEIFIMEIIFEGLREAGIRLPKEIGPLVSIVGALVIGEAAVKAGFISTPIVIVVSLAGISSFIIPRYDFGIPMRLLRFPLLILAGLLGIYGIAVGMTAILIHLVLLRSFGIPYLTPVAPFKLNRIKDVLIRARRKSIGSYK